MWSIVVPCTIDSDPLELLPIMPPSVARLEVLRVRPEAEPVPLGRAVEVLLHDARLHPHALVRRSARSRSCGARSRAPGRARPPSARRGSCRRRAATIGTPRSRADAHRGRDVVRVARERDRRRLDRVRARVRGEQMPGIGIVSHLTRELSLQRRRQLPHASTHAPSRYRVKRLVYRSGRHFLQIPGPTNVPDRVLRAIDAPTIDHRGPGFAELGLEVLSGMRWVFGTEGPVVIYPASGTGAWEAAIVNTLSPGDKVIASETGHFATLWREMAVRLGPERRLARGRLAPRCVAGADRRRARRRRARGDGRPQRDVHRRDLADRRRARGDGRPRRAAARGHDLVARAASTTGTTSGAWTSPSAGRRRA